jgi:Zn-dependent protease with chaperone function
MRRPASPPPGRAPRLFLGLLLLVAGATAAPARQPPPDPTKDNPAAGAIRHRTREPVPVPEPSEKAVRYYETGNVLWLVGTAWGLVVPCLFLFTGLSAKLRTLAQRAGGPWIVTLALYVPLFLFLEYLLNWPLAYYVGFVRQHEYGLSNQTFARWQGDSLKGLLVNTATAVLVLWIPYLLLRRSPRRWWLYSAVLAVPVACFYMLVRPVWIDPLFSDFGKMRDEALEARILALAERAGIQGGRVYEVDKSKDTRTLNAYVTGFGETKRIVLWDTLLARMEPDQVLFVMGHEMGHYVLGHVVQGIGVFCVAILGALFVAHRVSGALLRRFKERWGFDQLADVASLPLLILLVEVLALVVAPALLAWSRHIEHEADRFGLEITRDNHAAAEAFVRMQTDNLAVPRPGPLFVLWRASHPPVGERIDFANEYRPWEEGKPLRYGDLFRGPKQSGAAGASGSLPP